VMGCCFSGFGHDARYYNILHITPVMFNL
jgi:hypothetical protein